MKKTLIALAALTAVSAFAESSVTLYGSADAFFGHDSQTRPGVTVLAGPLAGLTPLTPLMNQSNLTPYGKNSQTVVDSGGLGPSRLGISVKEDLGNGQHAFAIIENELHIDSGTSTNARNPNRAHRDKTIVGLSGGWGSLSLGAQPTPLKDGSDRLTDAQSDSVFSAFNRAAAVSLTTTNSPYTPYIKNSVRYDLPAGLDGWRGAIALGTAKAIEGKKDQVFGFSLGYVVPGSWAVGFSHQTEKNGQNTAAIPAAPLANGLAVGANKITINYLSGAFGTPIGKFTLGFGGGKVSGATGHDRGWNLGWTAPIDNWTLIAQVASFKATGELGNLYNTGNTYRATPAILPAPALAAGLSLRSGSAKRTSFGVEARYSLSKRTTLYTGYNHTKNLAGVEGAKSDLFGMGMRHDF
jgi:predicted porin